MPDDPAAPFEEFAISRNFDGRGFHPDGRLSADRHAGTTFVQSACAGGEDFAKALGFNSLEDLKSHIQKRIEIDKTRWVEDDLRNQILYILLDQTKVELPQDFLSYHTDQRVYKHQLDLLNRGVPLEEIQKQTEAIKNASAESVLRELKASLIMNYIAEKEKIFVTENEVELRIVSIARAYNTDTMRVRKQLERQGNLSYLRNDMREGKVMNLLLKEAKIAE